MVNKEQRFGETVRKLRLQHGRTLQDLAAKLEVSVSYYSEVELGKRAPFKAEKIRTLASEFAQDFEALFALAWNDRQVIAFDPKECDPHFVNVLQSFARGGVTPEKWEEIDKILNKKDQ